MKSKNIAALVLMLIATSCIHKDLARTLHRPYEDGEKIGAQNINFQDLALMKKGESCTYNIFYIFPMSDSNSVIEAAKLGQVNKVKFVGETGFVTFPFSKSCTVVYGD